MVGNRLSAKRPFNIHTVLRRIRLEVKQFADAAMFDLAVQGYDLPFHQLVACIISVRTRDEVSLPTAIRLFEAAPTAEAISRMSASRIAAPIRRSSFYETKANNIRGGNAVSRRNAGCALYKQMTEPKPTQIV